MEKEVVLSVRVSSLKEISCTFTLRLSESGGAVDLSFDEDSVLSDGRVVAWPHFLSMDLAVPYHGNQRERESFTLNGRRASESGALDLQPSVPVPGIVDWNGLKRCRSCNRRCGFIF